MLRREDWSVLEQLALDRAIEGFESPLQAIGCMTDGAVMRKEIMERGTEEEKELVAQVWTENGKQQVEQIKAEWDNFFGKPRH